MKHLKPRGRPSAEEMLQAVSAHAPALPPTRLDRPDQATTLNLRLRASTVAAIMDEARARGVTMKQLVVEGVRSLGVAVAEADLEDRTPRRRVV